MGSRRHTVEFVEASRVGTALTRLNAVRPGLTSNAPIIAGESLKLGRRVKGVILADPFMNSFVFGYGGLSRSLSGKLMDLPELDGSQFPGVRVVIRNDERDVYAHGTISGGSSTTIFSGGCEGVGHHCTHPNTAAADVAMALGGCLAYVPC